MATDYQVIVKNSSEDAVNFCLYVDNGDFTPLVWQLKKESVGSSAQFKWDEKYSLVWSESGILGTGALFFAADTRPVSATNINAGEKNSVDMQNSADNGYSFSEPKNGNKRELRINVDNAVEDDDISIGIGIDGHPCLVEQALPGQSFIYPVRPIQYSIAAFKKSEEIELGQVLDLSKAKDTHELSCVEKKVLMVEYNSQNGFTFTTLKERNKKFVK